MQRIHRNDNGIFNALNAYDDFGGHALQHFRSFIQCHHCGVAGDAGSTAGCFVDFGYRSVKAHIADRADCHSSRLSEFQREDIAFIHVDRDLHIFIG